MNTFHQSILRRQAYARTGTACISLSSDLFLNSYLVRISKTEWVLLISTCWYFLLRKLFRALYKALSPTIVLVLNLTAPTLDLIALEQQDLSYQMLFARCISRSHSQRTEDSLLIHNRQFGFVLFLTAVYQSRINRYLLPDVHITKECMSAILKRTCEEIEATATGSPALHADLTILHGIQTTLQLSSEHTAMV
jgi:hypothetical protein